MSNIEIEITPIEEATDAILETIKNFYLKEVDKNFISPLIESNISKFLEKLNDSLYCIIEYPYVDKVYRDSYYNYYSSKHFTYHRDCIRVSLFEGEISQEDFLNPDNHKILNGKFMGYFTLRPILTALFGRSVINPKAFIENNFKICSCRITGMVYGVKLETEGFPHSSQDGETSKCAETTIWALMEYFGNKYAEYTPVLPAKIHKALERFSYQRQLPSNGLTIDQISFALKEFGFGTSIYSFESYGENLYEIIDSYVESGIPVIIGLEANYLGHVIIAVGKQYQDKFDWNNIKKFVVTLKSCDTEYYKLSSIPAKYVVQDDNHIPYRLIDLELPGSNYEVEDYKNFKIDSIVVPLYPKIYLETALARELAFLILKDEYVGYEFNKDFIFRLFLASSRSFKSHIGKLKNMDEVLKNNILILKMPKFIWCCEIYNKEMFNTQLKLANGLVILDATQANKESIDALIFAGYPDRCISINENNFVSLPYKFVNYSYFNNLK